jgi:trk system potassium uptake protein TrkH
MPGLASAARTSGFTILAVDELSYPSRLMLMVTMFIGGAPASMVGGVTVSTAGVLMVAVLSTVRGMPQAIVFGYVFPFETIAKAAAIMTIATLFCFFATLLLLTHKLPSFLPVAFEAVSAFSSSGYSQGSVGDFNTTERLLIILSMFWGWLGLLTLVIMLAQRECPVLARYPTEGILSVDHMFYQRGIITGCATRNLP